MAEQNPPQGQGRAAEPSAGAAPGRLEALMAAVKATGGRGPAPVENWDPPDCGDMDMRIAADGAWFYMGTPIGRPALTRLFASVLAREGARYVLKTPVEKIGITVDDAPFLAVEMAVDAGAEGGGEGPVLVFRTNMDDLVRCGPGHDLRFAAGAGAGELKPYLHVRRGLEALLTRSVFLELVERAEVRSCDGILMFGVASGAAFYPMMPADALDLAAR